MAVDFPLLMISAMYENGGNTTHRLLDGHPDMAVYPFESQLGTRLVLDEFNGLFPSKYRWPVYPLDSTPDDDFRLVTDEEVRVRARTPHVSKFRHVPFDFSDEERRHLYADFIGQSGRSRGANVAAFFRATFAAWRDYRGPSEPRVYVGYSPIVVVDAERILADLPSARILHVVRNPWSAYADTKKRPVPLPLAHYLLGWVINQHYALIYRDRYPDRVRIERYEDIVAHASSTLASTCDWLGLRASESLALPSWNGETIGEVHPWGTIRSATPEANRLTALELTAEEHEAVRTFAGPYLEMLGYASGLD
jgi:hypothetical protein